MAIPGDETPGAVASGGGGGPGEEVAHSGGGGGSGEEVATSKNDQEDVEMSDGLDRNVTDSKDTEDIDMDENRAEVDDQGPSQNLLEQDETVQPEDDAMKHKEGNGSGDIGGNEDQDDDNYGEVTESPESQDEEEDIIGLEGNVQDDIDSDVLKDSTNTGGEEVAEKLFRFPQGTIKRVMKLDPEVNLVNAEAIFLVNKATEQFVECLALEASNFMGGRKTLVGRDIFSAIESQDCLAFLEGAMDD